jgi:putative DNA methylase
MKRVNPIKHSIEAKGHTPQYRMHKYFARRPYNVFSNLISHYSKNNDIILDCFCGGGVTVFESAALGQKVIGVDINPLAAFITRMQMFNGDLEELKATYEKFIKSISEKYSNWYRIKFDDDEGICEWVEWAYVVTCPACSSEIVLVESNKISNGIYKCSNSECTGINGVRRVNCKPKKSLPLRARYFSKNANQYLLRNVDEKIIKQSIDIDYNKILNGTLMRPDFEIPLNWDRQFEDKLKEKGIVEYRHFFTDRNFALNVRIFNDILKMRDNISPVMYEYLYFLFSSSLRYSNNMTRVTENWEGGKPTAMDKHAFWVPNQYIETNIIEIIEKRAKAIVLGCSFSKGTLPTSCIEAKDYKDLVANGGYLVLNRSSSNLPLPSESISVIITDPPYGSNVQYAELSSIWNAWFSLFNGLDSYIYKDEEAVVNRKTKFEGAKSEEDYEELLFKVFAECNRVLKDEGYLVFTFNNKNIKVWIAMMKAVARAGFYLPEDGVVFQDFIRSYKNTAHLRYSGNIQGDFIYSFVKGKNPALSVLNGCSLKQLMEKLIKDEVIRLFNERKEYTTTELYQKIFTSLVGILMAYVSEHLDNENEMLKIEEYSNDYIDTVLKQHLIYSDDIWSKKEK